MLNNRVDKLVKAIDALLPSDDIIATLFHAIRNNDSWRIGQLIYTRPGLLRCTELKDGLTPFLYAVSEGKIDMANIFIGFEDNVYAVSTSGRTVLHILAETPAAMWLDNRESYIQFLKYLLENYRWNFGRHTPELAPVLHIATAYANADMCALLLEYGADLFLQDSYRLNNCLDIMEQTLSPSQKFPFNEVITNKCSNLLLNYIQCNQAAFVTSLLSRLPGLANVTLKAKRLHARTRIEITPLLLALAEGDYTTTIELLFFNSDPCAVSSEGKTALMYLCAAETFKNMPALAKDLVTRLVNSNVNINAQCKNGDTALHFAVRNQAASLVTILRELNADPLIANAQDISAMSEAQFSPATRHYFNTVVVAKQDVSLTPPQTSPPQNIQVKTEVIRPRI